MNKDLGDHRGALEDNLEMHNPVSVSAVITTYNRQEKVRRAIQGVMDQTYPLMEVIVVEDGSDSGIPEWLRHKGWDHVIYIHHDCNKGLAAARNTGLKKAQGEFIAYLDDDDEWKPQRIERQIELLRNLSDVQKEALGVIYCRSEFRFDEGIKVDDLPLNSGLLKDSILELGARTESSGFLFSAKALKHVGGFDESLVSSIDHDIWMSLAWHGYHAYYVDEPLVITERQQNTSAMTTDTERRIHGVHQYVKKWMPVYQEWLGDKQGIEYGRKYFAHVIGILFARNIAAGKFRDSITSASAIFQYSHRKIFTSYMLSRTTLHVFLKKLLQKHGEHAVRELIESVSIRKRMTTLARRARGHILKKY
ncbi:MAG: glycosyltransferase family 2 protein [bacterium]